MVTDPVARTLAMLVNEAADAVRLGVATPADVELAMTKGVNYPKGLLAWGDEYGVARLVARPGELPIGVVTAFLGVPFFVWLLRRRGAWRLTGGVAHDHFSDEPEAPAQPATAVEPDGAWSAPRARVRSGRGRPLGRAGAAGGRYYPRSPGAQLNCPAAPRAGRGAWPSSAGARRRGIPRCRPSCARRRSTAPGIARRPRARRRPSGPSPRPR